MTILAEKRLLITGVVNDDSMAFAVARRAQHFGAQILLTAFERDRERTEAAAAALDGDVDVWELDVTEPQHFDALAERIEGHWGHLDGALHAVAFAPASGARRRLPRLGGRGGPPARSRRPPTPTPRSLGSSRGLAPDRGASLVGLDFDAAGAWPVYNWMGVCKSALESVSRYVARDLGPAGIRSNLVAAGPLHTRAAGGIPEFERLTGAWERRSPIAWDPTDTEPVADAVCFLLSDLARAITGEILHVDGGYHAMAADLRPG